MRVDGYGQDTLDSIMKGEFLTVGELRRAIANLPDDTLVVEQSTMTTEFFNLIEMAVVVDLEDISWTDDTKGNFLVLVTGKHTPCFVEKEAYDSYKEVK